MTYPRDDAFVSELRGILSQWKAHDQPVESRSALVDGMFVCIEATSPVSGCSIDWMRRQVEELAGRFGAELLDSGTICYREGDEIGKVSFFDLEQAVKTGLIRPDTPVYDLTAVER
ncbi:MAG: hypothetical protein RMM53_10005, partial [Bacteroidia bacterium]|nr:hypothetical protein [Bacteroidia bacterium]MDW8334536.1 hypothetical protein [Bacteroidia bacterium]